MTVNRSWIRRRASVAVVVLALLGVGTFTAAFVLAPSGPPSPDYADAPDGFVRDGDGRLLARSNPVSVDIPAIGVSAAIVETGVAANGSIEVPPLDDPGVVGWYRYGPTPGEAGGAVLVGHVDSRASGPAVFFDLGRLHKGDRIEVMRDDGSIAVFAVDGVALYPKDEFPASQVHRVAKQALLRLITCGGRFDKKAHSYVDNVIVYASLI